MREADKALWETRATSLLTGLFLKGIKDGKDVAASLDKVEEFAGENAREMLDEIAPASMLGCVSASGLGCVITTLSKTWKPQAWPSSTDAAIVLGFEHRATVSPGAQKAWNGGLRLLNLLQFAGRFYVGCPEGMTLPAAPAPKLRGQ